LHLLDPLAPSEIVGIDVSDIGLDLAKTAAPFARLICASINDPLPFEDATFDVATIFNVLYHQWVSRSESEILQEVARIVKPDGLVLITEPAFEVLRRQLDDSVMTRRRYRLSDFENWLNEAGFDLAFGSYFTSFGFPLILVEKWLRYPRNATEKESRSFDMRPLPAFLNGILRWIALAEVRLLAHTALPFGTTLVVVGRRRARRPSARACRSSRSR
jgi:SAM-dependent methyltransferase